MDEKLPHENPNPTLTANSLSKLLFCWLNPLFKKGYKGWLDECDMYNVCPSDSSKVTGERLQGAWNKELEQQNHGKQPRLLRALVRAYGLQFMFYGLFTCFDAMVKLWQPVLLVEFLGYFTDDCKPSNTETWLYATGIVFSSATIGITHHHFFFGTSRTGMRIRVGLCSLMYRKCLRLSNKSLTESSVGQIVNLMSNDVSRFDKGMVFFHYIWVGPLQCVVAAVYLWYRLGPAVLAAISVMFLLMPLQILLAKLFSRLRSKTAVLTDKRVKVMNEIISGIRIIKLYCWEKPFGQLVEKLRRLETRRLRSTRNVEAWVLGSYFATARVAIFMYILVVVLSGKEREIRPGTVFLVMGVVQCLRQTCGRFVPFASNYMAEIHIVIKRIQVFLLLEEQRKMSCHQPTDTQANHSDFHIGKEEKISIGVEVTNLTANWEGNITETNTLGNITLSVRPGGILAVIGPVGSGKTSLLMSILGELPAQTGTVHARGKIAYVSQHPWIFSGSLRQNILFGRELDKTRYDKIIKICALSKDLSILPNGDRSLIGDRGITLSGGQRARVSLARALYMDADVILLDDPLAAVDTAVGKHIFNKCIMEYLSEKPRILVTHQVQLLPVADNIIILTDGKIVSQGTYIELSNSGVDFSEILKEPDEKPTQFSWPIQTSMENKDRVTRMSCYQPDCKRSRADSVTSVDSFDDNYVPDSVQLPEEEKREIGNIGRQVFMSYFRAGAGFVFCVLLMIFLLLAQLFLVGSDLWLARWTNKVEDRLTTPIPCGNTVGYNETTVSSSEVSTPQTDIPGVNSHLNLYVYAGVILAALCCSLARAYLFFKMAVTAGENLHNNMFSRILRTTLVFFDTNPVGRVLNRFSKDTGQLDDNLPRLMFDLLQLILQVVSIVIITSALNPWTFIAVVPLTVVFFLVRRYYIQTSRSVKRLEGTTRSPVFSHLSATLQGLHTIRAMNMEQRLTAEFDSHQDLHTEAWFLFLSTSRWLGIRIDVVSAVFIASIVYCSLLASESLDAGFVGLSVVYSVNLMGLTQYLIRQTVEVENQMVSVERVLQYTRLPIEADLESKPGQKPPDTWPSSGSLQAKGLSLRYSPTAPFVLKDINFDISGGEKIGIVGRTGAGKSSLITALFRLAEPEGELTIDGVSVHSLGLHDLRRVVSIIPQDPVLFSGTVRRNLDPFDVYSDSEIWTALSEVQLKEAITSHPDNLYMEVTEGGSNFSAGQRQLMCLARAVLGNTRILMIDEATANVDPITDELIQQTIRSKFEACTVLTIAHRLHTIIDSDRIMVLDAGKIVEMGKPIDLLSTGKGGPFYSMVEHLGKAELEHLTQLAANSPNKHFSNKLSRVNGVINKQSSDVLSNSNDTLMPLSSLHSSVNSHRVSPFQGKTGADNEGFLSEDTRL